MKFKTAPKFPLMLIALIAHPGLSALFAWIMTERARGGKPFGEVFMSHFMVLLALSMFFFMTIGQWLFRSFRRAYFSEDVVGCVQGFQANYRKGRKDGGWSGEELYDELKLRFKLSKAEGTSLTKALLAYGFPAEVLRDYSNRDGNQELLAVLDEESWYSTLQAFLLIAFGVVSVSLILISPGLAIRPLTYDFWKIYWPAALIMALLSGKLPLENAIRFIKPGGKE